MGNNIWQGERIRLRYQKCTVQVYTGGQFYDTLYFGIAAEEFATQD